jgi:hypothetical protein
LKIRTTYSITVSFWSALAFWDRMVIAIVTAVGSSTDALSWVKARTVAIASSVEPCKQKKDGYVLVVL